MSFRIRSTSSKRAAGVASTSDRTSSASPQGKRLGLPKGRESPLKQALVVHHANVQQISVTWFKLLTEHMEAIKRSAEAAAGQEPAGHKALVVTVSSCSSESADSANMILEKAAVLRTPSELVMTGERARSSKHARLIDPGEVRVSQHTVHEQAQGIASPMTDAEENLLKNEEAISSAIQEKLELLSHIFDFPVDEMDKLSESLLENKIDAPEGRSFLIASVIQANRLLESLNASTKTMRAIVPSEDKDNLSALNSNVPIAQCPTGRTLPAVPCGQLALIVPPLLRHLSCLLQAIKTMEEEMKQSRIELLKCKAEAGSCTSIVKEIPPGSVHNTLSKSNSKVEENAK